MKLLPGHGENRRKVVLSLCDYTGNWPAPFHRAGHTVLLYDLKHGDDLLAKSPAQIGFDIYSAMADHRLAHEVCAILMAPPCDHFTIAGSRFWKGKDEDGRTQVSVDLVRKCLAIKDYFDPDVWALENPVGRMGRLCPEVGLPWYFDPCDYAGYVPAHLHNVTLESPIEDILASNRYEKKTGIWGRNVRPPKLFIEPLYFLDKKGRRVTPLAQKLGGKSERTKTLRATTPTGFSNAFGSHNQR